LNSNSIEKKWDANWWESDWKSSHEYGVELLLTKKKTHKESSLNNTFENTLNKFQFWHCSTYNNNLWNLKVSYLNQLWWIIHCHWNYFSKLVKVLKNNSSKVSKIITIELWLIWDRSLGIQGKVLNTHMV